MPTPPYACTQDVQRETSYSDPDSPLFHFHEDNTIQRSVHMDSCQYTTAVAYHVSYIYTLTLQLSPLSCELLKRDARLSRQKQILFAKRTKANTKKQINAL
jgi:hypothetical protein